MDAPCSISGGGGPRGYHANKSTSATQRRTAFVLRLQENMHHLEYTGPSPTPSPAQ